MKIRRYEIDDVFDTLIRSQLHPEMRNSQAKFICIPRYNVCINLRSASIRFFFNYVYKVRTFKTYSIWLMLRVVALFPKLHGILNLLGLTHELKTIKSGEYTDWDAIDLLYIEWHFFGIFSKNQQSVTHVLAKEEYVQRFDNEINARRYGKQFPDLDKLLPRLLKVSDNPKFYTEELAVDLGKQLITKDHLNQAQEAIIKLNVDSLKTTGLDNYYREVLEKLGVIKNEELLKANEELLKATKLLTDKIENTYLHQDLNIDLALVHGDFNAGQILTKNGQIRIIDWGDGGMLNRFFDFITITIYKSPEHKYNPDFFPVDMSIMKTYFSEKIDSKFPLYILLSLLEILLMSKGEFEAKEGAYLRWIKAVENNL